VAAGTGKTLLKWLKMMPLNKQGIHDEFETNGL
jgi:hypothetical protein